MHQPPAVVRRSVVALLVVLAVAGCQALDVLPSGLGIEPPIALAPELLVQLDAEGGRCVDGTCESHATIAADGTVTLFDGTTVRMPPERVDRLVESIAATDWEAVLAAPFTGTCPTAYDGTERTWTIRTPDGIARVADCTVAVDYEAAPFRLFMDELSAPAG